LNRGEYVCVSQINSMDMFIDLPLAYTTRGEQNFIFLCISIK
jgi:hypothetical protein